MFLSDLEWLVPLAAWVVVIRAAILLLRGR